MFLQFMATLPAGVAEAVYLYDTKEMEGLVKQVLNHLETYDAELVDFLRDLSKRTCKLLIFISLYVVILIIIKIEFSYLAAPGIEGKPL